MDCLPGGGRLANAAGVEARVDPVEGRGWVGAMASDEKRVRDDERAAQLLTQTEADARRPATPGRPLILPRLRPGGRPACAARGRCVGLEWVGFGQPQRSGASVDTWRATTVVGPLLRVDRQA